MKISRLMLTNLVETLVVTATVSWLFYNSFFGFCLIPLWFFAVCKLNKARDKKRKREYFQKEFRQVLLQLAGELNAGYSLETTFYRMQERDFKQETRLEIFRICRGLDNQKTLENMILEWANRWDIQEIYEFASVVTLAKRYGGNMPWLIRKLCKNMLDCSLVDEEIQTMTASKRLEGNIMILVPFCILLYMKTVNGSYLSPLYENLGGRVLMSICLIIWLLSVVVIEKIVDIEV